jgi:hypothetical protein
MMVLVSKVAPAFDAWRYIQRLENEVAGLWGILGHDHRHVASTDGRTLRVSFYEQTSIFRKIRYSYGIIKESDGVSLCTAHESGLSVRTPQPCGDTGQVKGKTSQLFGIVCSMEREHALEDGL